MAFRLDDGDTDQSVSRRQLCMADMRTWLRNNKLKMNDDKTEAIVICSPSYRNKFQIDSIDIRIGNTNIAPPTTEKNIGVELDQKF